MPHFTPPAPYALEDNQDTLLDQSDLVFINPRRHWLLGSHRANRTRISEVDQDAVASSSSSNAT